MKTRVKKAELLLLQEPVAMCVHCHEQRVPVGQLSFNGTLMLRPVGVSASIMAVVKETAIDSMIELYVSAPVFLST